MSPSAKRRLRLFFALPVILVGCMAMLFFEVLHKLFKEIANAVTMAMNWLVDWTWEPVHKATANGEIGRDFADQKKIGSSDAK